MHLATGIARQVAARWTSQQALDWIAKTAERRCVENIKEALFTATEEQICIRG